jgi:hypothetical protein
MSHGRKPNRSATPEQIYHYTLMFWRMHLAVEEPDLAQLRDLHRSLCNQEMRLCENQFDFCVQNLLQRLQDGRSLGLQLSIPTWATAQMETLTTWAEEQNLLGKAQS